VKSRLCSISGARRKRNSHAIAAHPWIHEREGEQEKQKQKALVLACLILDSAFNSQASIRDDELGLPPSTRAEHSGTRGWKAETT